MRALPWILGGLAGFTALAGAQSPADALRAEFKPITLDDLPAGHRAVAFGDNLLTFLAPGLTPGRSSGALMEAVSAIWVDPEDWAALLEGRTRRIRGLSIDATRLADAAFVPHPEREPIFFERWVQTGAVGTWTALPGLDRARVLEALTPFREVRWAAQKTAALSNLKQLATGTAILLADTDDIYPLTASTADARRLLAPYVKIEALWKTLNPNGGRILYNTALSRLSATSIEEPQNVPLLWEEHAWPDGTRRVAFTDTSARSVSAARWEEIWRAELARRTKAHPRR